MTNLQRLHTEHGQSPWLDHRTRGSLDDGTLARLVAGGIRGVTANPTIVADITDALELLRPVFEATGGRDGFVSVRVAPEVAHDTVATIAAVRELHERIDEPNLLVKIPATARGVLAVKAMIAEGRSIDVTRIFSLDRYVEIIEAFLSGLEILSANGGDPSSVRSVAAFSVSRVDTEVDARLEAIGTAEALGLRGQAAIAQAKLAYQLFREQFSGPRWERLAGLGAQCQRPRWASMSTRNPACPDTRYLDALIGPDTVTTLPESTITAFEDHGGLARTVDVGVAEAAEVLQRLATVGVDLTDAGSSLEAHGIADRRRRETPHVRRPWAYPKRRPARHA